MKRSRTSPSTSSDTTDSGENQTDTSRPELGTNTVRSHNKINKRSFKHTSLRAGLAVVAGRTAGAISRRLHLGGGTSIVGAVAQRVYPEIVEHLATQLEYGSILVTGTNGKTTTSSFIAAIIRDGGLRVWRNREGSNLMRGVAGALVIRARSNGNLRRSGHAISVLETDEVALPKVVQAVTPRVIVFTNLFRDQLDRYGEVDTIIQRWQQTIQQLPATTTLVLNADDPTIAQLGEGFSGQIVFFGIDDLSLDTHQPETKRHQVVDVRRCARCGNDYRYALHFYSHLGHYTCEHCGAERPTPDIRATHIQLDDFDRYRMTVRDASQQHEIVVPLPGLYNVYNALAAISVAHVLNIGWEPITLGIEQSKPVFGRGERIQIDGKTMRLLLAKNPTGFNEVLRTVSTDKEKRHMLLVLNDLVADGRDVSWIWDVDFEQAVEQIEHVVVSGTRALDLALRLRYAGLAEDHMTIVPSVPLRATRSQRTGSAPRGRKHKDPQTREHPKETDSHSTAQDSTQPPTRRYGLKNALNSALQQTPIGETLFIVPTYTGLLEVHRELEQRGLTPHYWEGREA
jgi:lipid II isoglutaminyl synthase (glutamine-hydrolysing)